MSMHKYRRLTGLLFGAGLGLAYGLTSQLANRILLPGIPLYQPPLGPLGNILLSLLAGALLGVISAWPESSIHGTFIASAVSAVVILVGNFAVAAPSGNTLVAVLLTGIFLVLPFWAMLVPLIAALRWGVNKLVDAHADHLPIRSRITVPILLFLAIGVVGVAIPLPRRGAAAPHPDARLAARKPTGCEHRRAAASIARAGGRSLPRKRPRRLQAILGTAADRTVPHPAAGQEFRLSLRRHRTFRQRLGPRVSVYRARHRTPVQRLRGVAAMTEQRYRRAAGACIGMMFGFAYALVSQLVNRLALPGIPLYQPPLGPFGNILLGLLAGAGLGLLCAWPASAAKGILLGGAAAAAAIFAFTLLRMGAGAGVDPGRPDPLSADGLGERARHGRRALAGRPPGGGAAGVGPAAPPPAPAADPGLRAGARGCLRSL